MYKNKFQLGKAARAGSRGIETVAQGAAVLLNNIIEGFEKLTATEPTPSPAKTGK